MANKAERSTLDIQQDMMSMEQELQQLEAHVAMEILAAKKARIAAEMKLQPPTIVSLNAGVALFLTALFGFLFLVLLRFRLETDSELMHDMLLL
jgi:hypothetical protein